MIPAVFIDRDGTITKKTDLVLSESEIELEDFAAEGIRMMNNMGIKVIVITNQPQIARGLCTEEDVVEINKAMVKKVENIGARIDGIYFCPHHPEIHNDVPEHAKKYRIDCNCRKPKAGLIYKAAEEFEIDLENSFVIGDRTVDIMAGINAGCKTILVNTGHAGKDGKYSVNPDFICSNLLDAAKLIEINSTTTGIILAGGKGERLMPLTKNVPKPMIMIKDKPVIQYQFENMKKYGVTNFVVCASYKSEKIVEYFGDGSKFGIKIHYTNEPAQMGTGGALKLSERFVKSRYIVVLNGDVFIDNEFNIQKIIDYHKSKKCFLTAAVRESDHPKDSDVVKLNADKKIMKFLGKNQETEINANVGVFVSDKKIFDYIPEGISNIENDVIFKMLDREKIYGFVLPKNWFVKDMGTHERLESVRNHVNGVD